MNVEGYLTSTRNAEVDLSAVDLTVKKGDGESTIVGSDGALVLDNDTTAFKVGNTTLKTEPASACIRRRPVKTEMLLPAMLQIWQLRPTKP